MLKHLILPVFVVAIQTVAGYARYTRASVLDVSSSDYLRTARRKASPSGRCSSSTPFATR